MADQVKIKKRLLGGYTIAYKCECCSASLKSPLEDAGKSDTCPACGRQFLVPGVTERDRIRREEAAAAEATREEGGSGTSSNNSDNKVRPNYEPKSAAN